MQRWFITDHSNKDNKEDLLREEAMAEKSDFTPAEKKKVVVERTFAVYAAEVGPREAVFVTGDVPELGEWNYERMVPLVPQGAHRWAATIDIDADTDLSFRYCIAVAFDEPRYVSVRRWETNIHPRKLAARSPSTEDHVFGEYDGVSRVSRGWLTTDMLLQFKFFNDPLKLKIRPADRTVHVKVTPVTLSLSCEGAWGGGCGEETSASADTGEASDAAAAHVEVAVLNEEQCRPQPQPQFGRAYRPRDQLVVNVWASRADELAYLLDVYAETASGVEEAPVHVGSAYVLPDQLQRSEGQLELPLTCHVKRRPLGSVRVQYLLVRPMPVPLCDMSVSYAKHWDPSWTGLEVGHRGLGASFKTKEGNEIRENTIASLKRAAASGADLLEFDVQLSKDMVPIIYHDFYVCISMRRKNQLSYTDMLELPVKDLSLDHLHKLKVYHLVEGRNNEIRFFDEELEEHQPFPTLEQALSALDPHVGFNVELKWTMERSDGTFELNNPFDMNTYVDKVLEVILAHAGERRIVLSGFNPDICTMVRYKQNKYPVMFLTQGETERYPRYRDERCTSTPAAVQHALSSDILGVVAHTEDLLRDPTQVKLATDAGLVIFCWGDDNNNKDTITKLKEMGLHAVIYDKLDQLTTKQVKESIFMVEARESQRESLRAAGEEGASQAGVAGDAGRPEVDEGRLGAVARLSTFAAASTATVPSVRSIKRSRELIASVDKELQHKTQSSSFLGLFSAPAGPDALHTPDLHTKKIRSDSAERDTAHT